MYKQNKTVVSNANNRLVALSLLQGKVDCLEVTSSLLKVKVWLEEGCRVVAHSNTSDRHGRQIYTLDSVSHFKNFNMKAFKFFTKYQPRAEEYRVNIVDELVSGVFARKPSNSYHKNNRVLRTPRTGWSWEPISGCPDEVLSVAADALDTLGLQFGTVDLMWNNFRSKATVMDVHTSETLAGTMGTRYKEGFELIARGATPKTKPTTDYANMSLDEYIDMVAHGEVEAVKPQKNLGIKVNQNIFLDNNF